MENVHQKSFSINSPKVAVLLDPTALTIAPSSEVAGASVGVNAFPITQHCPIWTRTPFVALLLFTRHMHTVARPLALRAVAPNLSLQVEFCSEFSNFLSCNNFALTSLQRFALVQPEIAEHIHSPLLQTHSSQRDCLFDPGG